LLDPLIANPATRLINQQSRATPYHDRTTDEQTNSRFHHISPQNTQNIYIHTIFYIVDLQNTVSPISACIVSVAEIYQQPRLADTKDDSISTDSDKSKRQTHANRVMLTAEPTGTLDQIVRLALDRARSWLRTLWAPDMAPVSG
jgi:hypothetical protein